MTGHPPFAKVVQDAIDRYVAERPDWPHDRVIREAEQYATASATLGRCAPPPADWFAP
jgi:hypothetical protein